MRSVLLLPSWPRYRQQARGGFTLLELLITLAILGVLASMTVPVAQLALQRRHEQELRLGLREIRNALDAHKRASDEGRLAKVPSASGYPPSLDVLVTGVTDQRDPQGAKLFFLRRLPTDPLVARPGSGEPPAWGKRSYASDADNPQEGDDVYDVYSTAPGKGLDGVPYRQW